MTNRRSNGWADIVELDESPAAPSSVPTSPPSAAPPPAPPGPRPQLPRPAGAAEPSRALKMPVPTGPARAADAPRPITDDLVVPPPGAPTASARGGAKPEVGFSGEAFIDRLGAGAADKPAPKPGVSWREYRELIVTGVLGVLLLGGAIAWRVMNPPVDESVPPEAVIERAGMVSPDRRAPGTPEAPARAAEATPAPTADPTAAPADQSPAPVAEARAGAGAAEVAPSAPPAPVKAAVPMLSIITVPDGADLEIAGEIVGRSPLIVPAPAGTSSLRVIATKDGYERAEQTMVPNDGGHFSATLILEPKTRR